MSADFVEKNPKAYAILRVVFSAKSIKSIPVFRDASYQFAVSAIFARLKFSL